MVDRMKTWLRENHKTAPRSGKRAELLARVTALMETMETEKKLNAEVRIVATPPTPDFALMPPPTNEGWTTNVEDFPYLSVEDVRSYLRKFGGYQKLDKWLPPF
jgi:hypothetical protein